MGVTMSRCPHLEAASYATACTHGLCALLDVVGRAGWTEREHPTVVAVIADHPAWTLLHVLAAAAVVVAIAAGRARSSVLGVSGVLLVLWGGSLAWWGWHIPDPPVSLLGPALAFAWGVLAVILAHAWADAEV